MRNEYRIYFLHDLAANIFSRIWLIAWTSLNSINCIDLNAHSVDAFDSKNRPTTDEKTRLGGFFSIIPGKMNLIAAEPMSGLIEEKIITIYAWIKCFKTLNIKSNLTTKWICDFAISNNENAEEREKGKKMIFFFAIAQRQVILFFNRFWPHYAVIFREEKRTRWVRRHRVQLDREMMTCTRVLSLLTSYFFFSIIIKCIKTTNLLCVELKSIESTIQLQKRREKKNAAR